MVRGHDASWSDRYGTGCVGHGLGLTGYLRIERVVGPSNVARMVLVLVGGDVGILAAVERVVLTALAPAMHA